MMLTIFKAHPAQQAMSAAAAPADLNEAGFRRNPGEPDAAQAEDGDYRKPRVQWRGLTIAIENPAGSVRRGRNRHGVSWEIRMRYDYGEVVGSMGVDGDPVDIYLGPHLEDAPMVYVVHQRRVNDWDAYDEDKAMAGFLTETDAAQAFLSNYNDPRFLGPITAMPVDEFVAKVRATRERPAMIKALFLKTHVNTYTKKDGTVVAAHEDKRAAKHEPEANSDAWGGDGVVDAIQAEIDDDPHADWGLRVIPHGHPVSAGDELPPSYRWEDGEQTEDELDGTSAIGIRANGGVQRAIKVLNQGGYSGAQVALVRGESQGAGEDPGEILLSDAEVVKVWNRGTQMTKSATPVLLFFKGYVGPYLRGGRIVNVRGYHGRAAHGTPGGPGQMSLFGSNEPLPPSPLNGKDPVASTPDLFDADEHGEMPPARRAVREPTHTEPTRELIAEHERLVDVLNSPSHADDKVEAKKQAAELAEMKGEAGEHDHLLADIPGAKWKRGKGRIAGHYGVEVDGDLKGGMHEKPEDAVASAKKWIAGEEQGKKEKADHEAAVGKLRERLLSGGEVTDADLSLLGLRPGSAGLEWFIPAAAKVFGITSHAVRPHIKDMITIGHTAMGAKKEFVAPKKGLLAVAAGLAETKGEVKPTPKPQPTEAEFAEGWSGMTEKRRLDAIQNAVPSMSQASGKPSAAAKRLASGDWSALPDAIKEKARLDVRIFLREKEKHAERAQARAEAAKVAMPVTEAQKRPEPIGHKDRHEIGGLSFTARRIEKPRPHWRAVIDETGQVIESWSASTRAELWDKLQRDFQAIGADRWRDSLGVKTAAQPMTKSIIFLRRQPAAS